MKHILPPDQAERDAALDPRFSYIVQAPAGSGKTELLIQRYLRLLSLVDEPEEVLAVTFTLKAAGEMRSRVIKALEQAEAQEEPAEPHLRLGYELARNILGDERRRQWQLQRHPARLAIRTIDAVNTWIATRRPLAGGGSALQQVTTNARPLYREAARATIGLMAEDGPAGRQVAALMRHLGNDTTRVEQLLVDMLPRRDQWLRHTVDPDAGRAALERALCRVTEAGLHKVERLLPTEAAGELLALLPGAATALRDHKQAMQWPAWRGRSSFPEASADELPAWQQLAEALLTKKGDWRKQVTINCGFPPAHKEEKERMTDLLKRLSGHDALGVALAEVRRLPGTRYQDEQWAILQALRAVLPLAAAQLRLSCAARGETDFAEVAATALEALGSADEPSDLALLLDYRLQHLLVDEFQDTSLAQYRLLERLMAGWMPGDGRSCFLVGDPMQSIYRFREADVSLFMQVRDQGIGEVHPRFLRLKSNFRSAPALVEWCNEVFARIFPAEDDEVLAAVRFATSDAARPASPASGVSRHWLTGGGHEEEAALVVDLLKQARNEDPAQDICILVRSRSHASYIISALRKEGVGFVAPEMEQLDRSSIALELLALTRALWHPADRLAWIGVLRAPWCGLSLADLVVLLADDHDATVADLLRDEQRRLRLSPAGAAAVGRLREVLDRVEAVRERQGLREVVEGAWLMLGGPAAITEESQLESAETFFALLETAGMATEGLDLAWLTSELPTHKGSLGSGQGGLRIMTIHKAKGLEFDTVILPGLHRRTGNDDALLLVWQEVLMPDGDKLPMLAPIPATGEEQDPLYGYLTQLDRQRAGFEMDRLLYVACTRARRHLHLVAQLSTGAGGEVKKPQAASLLARLWPALSAEALAAVDPGDGGSGSAEDEASPWAQPLIRRLPAAWQLPAAAEALALPMAAAATQSTAVVYEWASRVAMHVGTVVHAFLQIMGEGREGLWSESRIRMQRPVVRRMLQSLGVARHELDAAANRVMNALLRTLADERGRWILDPSHAEAASELALTVFEQGQFRTLIIDRSFIADGVRWIIDFKTSEHLGGDLDEFVDSQRERYRAQLCGYRRAMQAMHPEPVRTALYFPLLGIFCEVACDVDADCGAET